MPTNTKYFPVNWIDGMKINKTHFLDLQDSIEDSLREARALTSNNLNYGLLPTPKTDPHQYNVMVDAHGEATVKISQLKVLTPAGGLIEISNYTEAFQERITLDTFNLEPGAHFLILNINPFERIPCGIQNMEEIPPRFPHTTAKYFLSTLSISEVTVNNIGAFQFPIAKFTLADKKIILEEQYIVPTTTVSAHKELASLQESLEKCLQKLENNSVQISKKINFRRKNDDRNHIAEIVYDTVDNVLQFVGSQLTMIKWKGNKVHPMEMLNHVSSLSRVLKNSFDAYAGDGKEMIYDYFCEWTRLQKGDYEKLFIATTELQYLHYDLKPAMNQAVDFIEKINELFETLHQLDYIGRKKDAGIFVNENIVKTQRESMFLSPNASNENTSPSFLAE